MRGKQARSDDCSTTANYSDNSGEIRHDTRNFYHSNNYVDQDSDNSNNNNIRNNNRNTQNNEFDQFR